jgi:Zn-dependent protease with chaperone function
MNLPLFGLRADDFRHPLDFEATTTLKQIPGLPVLIRSLLGEVGEQFFYLENIASGILVGPNQLPDLYALLQDAARVLDVEVPQLYIHQDPSPNAYTFAMRGRQPFVVLHTSLIDMLEPEEVKAVIAHELGHLKCEHGVYLTLANLLMLAAEQIPMWGQPIVANLEGQMMEWVRCAEFSCDRAALLAIQDPRVVASVLMKLSGGSPKLSPLLNLDAFIDQARAYDQIDENEIGELLKQMQTEQLSHPVPVLRAREIDRWSRSREYQSLLNTASSGYNGNLNDTTSSGKWRNW